MVQRPGAGASGQWKWKAGELEGVTTRAEPKGESREPDPRWRDWPPPLPRVQRQMGMWAASWRKDKVSELGP